MISVDQALSQIFEQITPLASEMVPWRQASGRVLIEDVVSRLDLPPDGKPNVDEIIIKFFTRSSEAVVKNIDIKVCVETITTTPFPFSQTGSTESTTSPISTAT